MKILIFFLFLSGSLLSKGQEIKAFLKSPETTSLSLEEFKGQKILQLTDSSLKIYGYVAWFSCDWKLHAPTDKNCIVTYAVVEGNSLADENFMIASKKFTNHFTVVFDNVRYLDKNGNLKVLPTVPIYITD